MASKATRKKSSPSKKSPPSPPSLLQAITDLRSAAGQMPRCRKSDDAYACQDAAQAARDAIWTLAPKQPQLPIGVDMGYWAYTLMTAADEVLDAVGHARLLLTKTLDLEDDADYYARRVANFSVQDATQYINPHLDSLLPWAQHLTTCERIKVTQNKTQKALAATDDVEAVADEVATDETAKKIITELFLTNERNAYKLLKNSELQDKLGLSNVTAIKALKRLLELGLVERPRGKNKGQRITRAGREIFSKMPKK